MQVTQKMRPALREQSGHHHYKKHAYDGSHSSTGCGSAPAGLTLGKKIAPRQDDSGGDKHNKSTIPQFHVEVVEHMRPNDTGSVTRVTLGKKIASHGTQTGRGIQESQTCLLLPERRQVAGIRQVGPAQTVYGELAFTELSFKPSAEIERNARIFAAVGGFAFVARNFAANGGLVITALNFEASQIHVINERNFAPSSTYSLANTLTLLANRRYAVGAAAKSAAGIRTPNLHTEPTHAPIAWFFVGTRPPFTWVLLAYPAFGIYRVMVARVGQPSGWPVSSVCAGSTNPIRATTMRFVPLCGSDNLLHMEAAIMATVPTPVTPEIQLIDGKAVTSSLALANYFGKNHRDVLRKITQLECSPEYRQRNFAQTVYDRPNPAGGAPIPTPCYLLTRDGFFFVAMGFTGQRAAEFKEAYIAAFNALEQRLALPLVMARLDHHWLQDTSEEAKAMFKRIHQHWDGSIYPMLVAARSPLAVELHDCFIDMAWLLSGLAHYTRESGDARTQGGRRHEI